MHSGSARLDEPGRVATGFRSGPVAAGGEPRLAVPLNLAVLQNWLPAMAAGCPIVLFKAHVHADIHERWRCFWRGSSIKQAGRPGALSVDCRPVARRRITD